MRAQKQFRVRDAAVLLGLTKNQVYNLIKHKQLGTSGRRPLRVNLDAIQKYLIKKFPVLVWFIPDTLLGRNKTKSYLLKSR